MGFYACPFSWEFHHFNWLIRFRGVGSTTNQFSIISPMTINCHFGSDLGQSSLKISQRVLSQLLKRRAVGSYF
jgi:hypothetical protein